MGHALFVFRLIDKKTFGKLQSLPEGVADRASHARGIGAGKVCVVVDEVDAGFGTNEESFHQIQLEASAKVSVEVRAAGNFTTAAGETATVALIQMGAHGADATDQFEVDMAG